MPGNKRQGERFARLREESGWSVNRLARLLNCSHVTVLNWESGLRAIPPEIMEWMDDAHRYLRRRPDYQTLRTGGGRPLGSTVSSA